MDLSQMSAPSFYSPNTHQVPPLPAHVTNATPIDLTIPRMAHQTQPTRVPYQGSNNFYQSQPPLNNHPLYLTQEITIRHVASVDPFGYPFPTMPSYSERTPHTTKKTGGQSDTSANQLRFAIYEGILGTYVPRPDCIFSGKQEISTKSDCIYSNSHANSSYEEIGYSSVSDSSTADSSDASLEKVSSDEPSLMELLDEVEDSCNYFRDILCDLDERNSPNDVTSILPEPPKQTFRNLPSIVIKKNDSPAKSCRLPSQTFPCDICSETFPSLAKLKAHMSVHSKARRHVCNVCQKAFSQRTTLRTHLRVHTGERPFKCSMCPKAFADYSTCSKHERTHTGERPYVCPTCGKGFAQSGNMLRHKLIHSKQKKKEPKKME